MANYLLFNTDNYVIISSMIERIQEKQIRDDLGKGKVIILYGPRRIGKTTLAKKLLDEVPEADRLYLNCDEQFVRNSLEPFSLDSLEQTIGKAKRIVIDEAQRVANIGLTLKILIDAHPDLDIIATGSSSFDLANKIKEPMTGRAYEHVLTPLSLYEVMRHYNYKSFEVPKLVEKYMRFGAYPGVIGLDEGAAAKELRTIVENYVYKDSLEHIELRQRQILPRLLQALALQVGGEVSYNELANLLDTKVATIERYITLLELAFIVYRLPALTGKSRTMLSNRKRKVYFYDLGVRNMLISQTGDLSIRQDVGALWENYCVNEYKKTVVANGSYEDYYYWRGLYGEVDLVTHSEGVWKSFECKWSSDKKPKIPNGFKDQYPDASFTILSPRTLFEIVTPEL